MDFAQEINEPDVCRKEGCKLCIMEYCTKKSVYIRMYFHLVCPYVLCFKYILHKSMN